MVYDIRKEVHFLALREVDLITVSMDEYWNCPTTFSERLPYRIKKKKKPFNGLGADGRSQTKETRLQIGHSFLLCKERLTNFLVSIILIIVVLIKC
jgi:hypothetical protein